MTRAVSLATWIFLTSVALPADIRRPVAAVKEGVQVNDPAAKIPVLAPKKELRYEIEIKHGRTMMNLHNPSDLELAIQFGKTKALLRAGARTKIEFPDQQIAELKVFTRRREEWRLLFSARVPRQPAKAAIPLKP
jgi:hypothetical protein